MYEDFAEKLSVTMWPDVDEVPARDGDVATIVDLRTTVVDGNYPWTLVEVETDAGVIGIGEAYPSPGLTEIITDFLRPVLVGQPPVDVERLYHLMRESLSGRGSQAGVATIAISGVELALWDAAGKLLDVPVYQLLGGKVRDTVLVYADCHAGEGMVESATGGQATETYRPDAYADAARTAIADGFELLKFDLDVPSGRPVDGTSRRLDRAEVEHKRQVVEATVDAVGEDAEVGFDLHWNFTVESAERLCRAIEPYDVAWIEDPIPPENTDALAELRGRIAIPILTGENRYGRHGFRDLAASGAVDFLAPDVPKTGGIAESKRIAELGATHYQSMVPHNVGSPVATMAAAHLGAAVPNFLALEFHARDVPWWEDLVTEDVIDDGRIRVPDAPGLGVTVDWDVVDAHRK